MKIVITKGCLLNPSDTAAVVGGNVLTSQRVTDVVLKAFRYVTKFYCCNRNTSVHLHSSPLGLLLLLQGLRGVPRLHEQPHLRQHDDGLLRDYCWWRRGESTICILILRKSMSALITAPTIVVASIYSPLLIIMYRLR